MESDAEDDPEETIVNRIETSRRKARIKGL
jgi:hypothetical protein